MPSQPRSRALPLLASAALLLAALASAQQPSGPAAPEIVVRGGDLHIRAGGIDGALHLTGDAFLNGERLATGAVQQQLDTLRLAVAGATLGPDAQVTVLVEAPAGTRAYAGDVTAAWAGLATTAAREAYSSLPQHVLAQLQDTVFCGPQDGLVGRVTVSWTDPGSGTPDALRASVRVAPAGSGCTAASAAVERVFATLAVSLRGELMASRTGAQTRARLDTLEQRVGEVDGAAQAALAAAEENRELVAETVAASIEDLTADISDIHGCHKDGLLYSRAEDACVPVVPERTCSAQPPGAPAQRASVAGADPAAAKQCGAASRVSGSNSTCEFRCDAGFTQTGAAHWRCERGGIWARLPDAPGSPAFECVPVECGDPRQAAGIVGPVTLGHRRQFFQEATEGSGEASGVACGRTARYMVDKACVAECVPGHSVEKAVLVCGADGEWRRRDAGGKTLQCSPVRCPASIPDGLEPDLLGNAACPDRRFKFNCPLACADGFEGKTTARCGADGKWAVAKPANCAAATEHGFFSVRDPNAGCPDTNRNINALINKEFELAVESVIWLSAHIIREAAGRDDVELYVDDTLVDRSLVWSTAQTWKELHLTWAGTLPAGKHTVRLRGLKRPVFGCNAAWSGIEAFWISTKHARVYNIKQVTDECPRATSGILAQEFIDVASEDGAFVVAAGHIIAQISGRSDVSLVINDDVDKTGDRTLGWTDPAARDGDVPPWGDHHVHWVGKLPKGTHKVQLTSPQKGFGCGSEWGDFQVIVVEDERLFQVENVPGPSTCRVQVSAGTTLAAKTVSVPRDGMVMMLVAHLVVRVAGRADLQLLVDGSRVDWTMAHTDTTSPTDAQYSDARVSHIGAVSKGQHRVELRSAHSVAEWGCNGGEWGDLDIVLVG